MGQLFSLDCLASCIASCTGDLVNESCCDCLSAKEEDDDVIDQLERRALAIAQKYLEDNLHIHINRSLPDLLTSHMDNLAHHASEAARHAAEHLIHSGRNSRPSTSPNSPAPPRPRGLSSGRLSRPGSARTSPERPLRVPVLTVRSTASPRTSPAMHHRRLDAVQFSQDELVVINMNPDNNLNDTPEGDDNDANWKDKAHSK